MFAPRQVHRRLSLPSSFTAVGGLGPVAVWGARSGQATAAIEACVARVAACAVADRGGDHREGRHVHVHAASELAADQRKKPDAMLEAVGGFDWGCPCASRPA